MKRRYEIRDDQWDRIKDILPPERKKQGGRIGKDNRVMINAMLWVARSGAPWRDLPDYYPSWKTVYIRFRRWQMAGIWDKVLEHVSISPDFENIMIDATLVRVHQHGAGAKWGRNFKPWDAPEAEYPLKFLRWLTTWAILCALNLRLETNMIASKGMSCSRA